MKHKMIYCKKCVYPQVSVNLYVDDDGVQRLIKEKEEEILRLLKRDEEHMAVDQDREKLHKGSKDYFDNEPWNRHRKDDIYNILDIVEEYDISLDFIIKALGVDEMGGRYKSMIVHMLLDERVGMNRRPMFGNFCY